MPSEYPCESINVDPSIWTGRAPAKVTTPEHASIIRTCCAVGSVTRSVVFVTGVIPTGFQKRASLIPPLIIPGPVPSEELPPPANVVVMPYVVSTARMRLFKVSAM